MSRKFLLFSLVFWALAGVVFWFSPAFAHADYSVDTNSGTTGVASIPLAAGEHLNIAQQFTTIGAGTTDSVDFCLYSSGVGTGNLTLDLQTVSAGDPSGVSLGTATIPVGDVTGTHQRVHFTFASPVSLSASTAYYLVLAKSVNDGVISGCGDADTPAGKYSDNGTAWSSTAPNNFNINVDVVEGGGGASTTAGTAATTTVFNPNQDFANGLFLFTAWFFGIYWLFSKKR